MFYYSALYDELLAELREQDEVYHKLNKRREEIAKLARGLGVYQRMWDELHSDRKAHVSF